MPAWTKEEDEVLTTAVRLYGVKAWSIVACALRGRTGKQCRERYQHQLLHSKTVKTSAALLATERKFSNTYESTAHMLRQAFSTNSKQLRVDTSTACLSAVDRTLEETFGGDDAPVRCRLLLLQHYRRSRLTAAAAPAAPNLTAPHSSSCPASHRFSAAAH